MPFPAMAPKILVGVYQRHHQVGVPRQQRLYTNVGVFYRLRVNPQEHRIPLYYFTQNYTKVVIFISAGKATVNKGKLVNNSCLDI